MSQFGFSLLPNVTERYRNSRLVRRSTDRYQTDKAVMIDSSQVDSNAQANSNEILAGNVIVFSTSKGNSTFVLVGASGADVNTPASVTGSNTTPTFAGTDAFTFTLEGGTSFTVTTQAGSTTTAGVVTDLNNNATFAAHLKASSASGALKIVSLKGGADAYFNISGATPLAAAGITAGMYAGADADYRIMLDTCVVVDASGAAAHAVVLAADAGEFLTANLYNLTAEAYAVLRRKGCKFYTGPGSSD